MQAAVPSSAKVVIASKIRKGRPHRQSWRMPNWTGPKWAAASLKVQVKPVLLPILSNCAE